MDNDLIIMIMRIIIILKMIISTMIDIIMVKRKNLRLRQFQ